MRKEDLFNSTSTNTVTCSVDHVIGAIHYEYISISVKISGIPCRIVALWGLQILFYIGLVVSPQSVHMTWRAWKLHHDFAHLFWFCNYVIIII